MTRQCLIVRGGWPGHDPVGSTDLFVPWLEGQGFVVDIEDTPEVYADAHAMARYDLIVQSVTMGSATVDEVAGLRAAVAAGAGFAGWHGGIIDSFRSATDFLQLTGAQFAAHPHAPEDRGRGDVEAYRRYTVRFTDAAASHPITQGLTDFEVHTEQYWVLDDGLNDVLADCELIPGRGDEWARTVTMPVAWTRQWGQGRIFATTLGHTLDVLRLPQTTTLIERGMAWAAR
ncbi:ThuA domain-containing protein [Demequina sp. NBRC 110057]|uniref:ThuA domain-containing protein n=1 Tax=Demequina sp. NBRC 110057 TaxID=1570346 RepID=UPI0009FD3B20|nr:ThuA domain-containing protein [Demequina sp. NBRC 110057]